MNELIERNNKNTFNNNFIQEICLSRKIKINEINESSHSKILFINCILDFKSFINKNFRESLKGYLFLSFITLYFINRKRPYIYNIKNNFEFSNSLVSKNKLIKVNVIKNDNFQNTNQSLKFTYSLEYKYINQAFTFISNLKKLITNLNKKLFKRKNEYNLNNIKNEYSSKIDNKENKEIEILKGIDVKLCGIKDLTEEGIYFVQKLIYDKNSKIFLHFNHILYMDTPEIFCWIYIYNKKFSFSRLNLNIFLVKQGLANVNPVKLNDIYDERIFYNYSDLLDAERNAKEKSLGIWSKTKNKVTIESSIKNERFSSIFDRFGKRVNMRKWEKSILNK